MIREILDYNNVTLENKIISNFNFRVYESEKFGLIFINNQGKDEFIKSLLEKTDLEFGNIFINSKLYNSYSRDTIIKSNVSYIGVKSSLISSLSIADNIFLLKKTGNVIIKENLLKEQLKLLIRKFNLDLNYNSNINNIGVYQRVIIELLKAYVANSKIIILNEISSCISKEEINKLNTIINLISNEGISIIHIETHYNQMFNNCKRIGLVKNGKIIKITNNKKELDKTLNTINLDSLPKNLKESNCFNNKIIYKMSEFGIIVKENECINILDSDNSIINKLINKLKLNNDLSLIKEDPLSSMLFYNLSYIDNLCFLAENKVKNFFFSRKYKKSVIKEFYGNLGSNIYLPDLYSLSSKDLYELVYYRILLLKPKVVFCVKPFTNVDTYQRIEIINMLKKFKENNIAVVILSVNINISLKISDKLLVFKAGKILNQYNKEQFDSIK